MGVIFMKRLLILMIGFILLLAACGSDLHKNVRKDIADDTNKIISIVENAIDEERELNEDELETLEKYQDVYNVGNFGELDIKAEEAYLISTTETLSARDLEDFYSLPSDKKDFDKIKNRIEQMMTEGIGG